ncbi:MAG: hypothetical protein KQH63_03515, partial [Desulfobulbaceae bacterium]|nr:hypothetical protein [Desulfobulbaceae bacterium]
MRLKNWPGLRFIFVILIFFFCLVRSAEADTPVFGLIETDTVFNLANSPYLITSTITVAEGATLTVEAGVSVLFDSGTGLVINGVLLSQGSEENPIVYTRSGPNSWTGITLNASELSRLDHVAISHASTGLSISNCNPELGNLEFFNSSNGLYLNNSSPEIDDFLFQDNSNAIYMSNSSPHIHNCRFLDNANGIWADGICLSEIDNNWFSGSTSHALYYNGGMPSSVGEISIRNNVFTAGQNGITISFSSDTLKRTVAYNTFMGNSGYAISLTSPWTEYLSPTEITANIVVANERGIISDNNLTLSGGYNNIYGNNTFYENFQAYATDFSSHPLFDYETAYDFRLKPESPCRTAGPDSGEIGAYGNNGNPEGVNTAWRTEMTSEGTLPGNERWSGTVTITTSVTVPSAHMLFIEPGTELLIASGATITGNGIVIAEGTESYPITLTRANDSGGWGTLSIQGALGNLSSLSNLHFSHASTGLSISNCNPELNGLE